MKISILLVQYNKAKVTIRCLNSLLENDLQDTEIILVDNHSEPEEKQAIKNYIATLPQITLIENESNLGFSDGCNVGIRHALRQESEWILLLNNDTTVEKDFLVRVRNGIQDRSGIVGLSLRSRGDRIAYAGIAQWLNPRTQHSYTQLPKGRKPLYVIGAAMLIHRDVFEKIGMFDEKYFLYYEDVDFCARAKKAGLPISFIPEITVNHAVSSSTRHLGALRIRYCARNALYFNYKNGPWLIKILAWIGGVPMALPEVLKIVFGNRPERSKAILNGILDFYKGNYGKLD